MSDESSTVNWVERKHRREVIMASEDDLTELWNEVRVAIQGACASFQAHYGEVECKLENGKRVLVSTGSAPRVQVIVAFEQNPPRIAVAFDQKSAKFLISADHETAFIANGPERLTPDELSQRILEPVLFPAPVKGSPSRPPAGPPSAWP